MAARAACEGFKRVNWFDWGGGDVITETHNIEQEMKNKLTETHNIEQEMKNKLTRGGGKREGEGGPAEKRNPEHRGCVENQDMAAETKIALCGHAACFHFMSQYPIYTHTHTFTHFSQFPTHFITLTQMGIKTQICTHKQKHTLVLIYSHIFSRPPLFSLFHSHDLH